MKKITLYFDVSEKEPFSDTQVVCGWLFLPDGFEKIGSKHLVVCLPGGTYSKRYFHFTGDKISGYSMAEYLTAYGHAVLSLDHLGVGDSTAPKEEHLTGRSVHAKIYDHIVKTVLERFEKGSILPELPKITNLTVTGVGHSMGGMILVTQQGRYQTYDRIIALGWVNEVSAIPPVPEYLLPSDESPVYTAPNRKDTRSLFYMDDVPERVISADEAAAMNISRTLLRELLTPGVVLEEAGKITVPVFIGFGERDMSLCPHTEPKTYLSSSDVTLYILKGSGHCHNFASSRTILWRRITNWMDNGTSESQPCLP